MTTDFQLYDWQETGDSLLDLIGELMRRPCVTGEEGPIADYVCEWAASRGDMVMRIGNSVVVSPPGEEHDTRPVVALVGHLDVVPPTDDDVAVRLIERELTEGQGVEPIIVGRGISDMKAGLGVLMHTFIDEQCRNGKYRLVLVAYAGEEGAAEDNELIKVLEAVPGLADVSLAIIGEPTDGQIQLGCMGGLHALVHFPGKQSHSARPWQGVNALVGAGEWLSSWADEELVEVTIDGLTWREAMTPTQGYTTNARNIVPGVFSVDVNYRFAPNKTLDEAQEELIESINKRWKGSEPLQIEIIDRAPPCPPFRGTDIVEEFIEGTGCEVAPKQAWTDVARFAEVGVPALNYSPAPGDQAHQRGELMRVADIAPAAEKLKKFFIS